MMPRLLDDEDDVERVDDEGRELAQRWCRLGDHLLHSERERRDGVCVACGELWERIEAEVEG